MANRRVSLIDNTNSEMVIWRKGVVVLDYNLVLRDHYEGSVFTHDETTTIETLPEFLRNWADEVEKQRNDPN